MTPHSTFRLSEEAKRLLGLLAEHFGISRTAVIEWLVREKARALGLLKKRG